MELTSQEMRSIASLLVAFEETHCNDISMSRTELHDSNGELLGSIEYAPVDGYLFYPSHWNQRTGTSDV